jgi:hypothetical protein
MELGGLSFTVVLKIPLTADLGTVVKKTFIHSPTLYDNNNTFPFNGGKTYVTLYEFLR